MEATNINPLITEGDKKVIDGLRESLQTKEAELSKMADQVLKEKEKSRKSRETANKVKASLKEAEAKIERLTEELGEAAINAVDTGADARKIETAMIQLNTIVAMNGNSSTLPIDSLNLIVQTLTGNDSAQLLLS